MTTLALGPVIGRIGGGRESQEITLTGSDQTITLGEGRWLMAMRTAFYLDGGFTDVGAREIEGPATHRVRMFSQSATLYIAPLTD